MAWPGKNRKNRVKKDWWVPLEKHTKSRCIIWHLAELFLEAVRDILLIETETRKKFLCAPVRNTYRHGFSAGLLISAMSRSL